MTKHYIIGSKEEATKDLVAQTIPNWDFIDVFSNIDKIGEDEDFKFENEFLENDLFNSYKHIQIIDENFNVKYYWYRHAWFPEDDWFRMFPLYKEVKNITNKKTGKKAFKDIKPWVNEEAKNNLVLPERDF